MTKLVTMLSKHFTLAELTASEMALRKGIDNTPSPEIVHNLKKLASALERARELLGHPIHISSGYRSPALNRAIGGSKKSAHMSGMAVDFTCPGYGSPKKVAKMLAQHMNFDQLIYEGTWVHLGLAWAVTPEGMLQRNEVLTAHFENGKVTYTQGIA